MNNVEVVLAFLKLGIKSKRPSYALIGGRKRLYDVLKVMAFIGWWAVFICLIYLIYCNG